MMNQFDEIISKKLSSLEGDYDESVWKNIETELDKSMPSTHFSSSLLGGIAASVALGLMFTSLPDLGNREAHSSVNHPGITIPGEASEHIVPDAAAEGIEHAPQEVHDITFISHHLAIENKGGEVGKPQVVEKQVSSNVSKPDNSSLNPAEQPADKAGETTGMAEMNIDFVATGIQCPGSEISFKALVSDPKVKIEWLFDGIYIVEGRNVKFSFDGAGEHEAIMLCHVAGAKTMKLRKPFRVYETPSLDMSHSAEYKAECFNQEVTFKAVPNSNTYQWSVDGKAIGNGASLKTLLAAGTHNAELTAINAEGCTATETAVVTVEPGLQIFAPNSFTPNGDGRNDTWFPVGLEEAASFSLEIVRFQDKSMVFESNEIITWDGNIRGTSERPGKGEKFIWNLVVTDQCGQQKQHGGIISIL